MPEDDWGLADEIRFQEERRRAELDAAARENAEEQEAAAQSMMDWSLKVPEPKFGILDFEQFPYQLEWYSDLVASAIEVAWRKSTQVGMSAYAWRWGARRADQFMDTCIYVFPTDRHVTEFGDERIEPSIEDSEYLQSRIKPGHVKNKHQKRIGGGWMYLRGSTSRAGAQSVAGEALVFDEYDELDQKNLGQMERRLSGARAAGRTPRTRRLGVPTLPAWGIDAQYLRSDRREWRVTCPSCQDEQPIEWERNVRWSVSSTDQVMSPARDEFEDADDVAAAWRICRTCEHSLEPPPGEKIGPIHRGRWVPTRPGRKVIGYHVSRLIVPLTDLVDIVKNSRKTKTHEVEAFWNNDLGLPYVPAEAGLTEDDVRGAMTRGRDPSQGYRGQWPVVMGIDAAGERDLNVAIYEKPPDGPRMALWLGTVHDFDDLYPLMASYNVTLAVVDSMPERKQARTMARNFPGRVVLVRYDDTNPEADPLTFDDTRNMLTLHRTEAIDGMMDAIRHGRQVPLRQVPHLYVSHMVAMKRRNEEDKRGRMRRVYVTTGGKGDDFAHAETYVVAGSDLLDMRRSVEEQQWLAEGEPADDMLGVETLNLAEYPTGGYEDPDEWLKRTPFGGPLAPDDYDPGFGGF